ncbi:helix-turn-helix domain-containing protein [Streptomyces sp. CRN 30]|uniref:PucR family transcriptional regulator n=1 Tax=Streptomyces sp. CRN 30 TaxID=3075613 RepID=UPI002A81CA79|nr:helix-turn-helix domain-containing protein [Streptomyces sp. CRN 30]
MADGSRRARAGSEELRELVEELADRLRRSVVLDDPLVRLVCSSRHFGDADPVRVRSLLQGRADDEIIRYVLDQGVTQWRQPAYLPADDGLGFQARYCVPLREHGHLLGLLMVLSPEEDLTEQETADIDKWARLVATQMYAEHLADGAGSHEAREQEQLLALIGASPAARTAARRHFLGTGTDTGAGTDGTDVRHALVTVVQVTRTQEPPGRTETALRGALERFRRTRRTQDAVAVSPDRAVLLQFGERAPDAGALSAQSAGILEALGTFLDAGAAPVLGVGGAQAGLADAWVSYEQALVAARAARRLPRFGRIARWEELGEYAVLLQLPDRALNASLLPGPLRALLEAPGGPRLVDTLSTFLEHAGSVPRTAESLGIHRTSLYYRLRQIQDITGLDLDSGADRLVLHLGLRLDGLLQSEKNDTAGSTAAQ